MVINITATKTDKETIQYNVPEKTPNNIIIHNTKDKIAAPKNNPIAAIASPFNLPLLSKAINAIKPKTKAVMPNVNPNKLHGTKIHIVDSMMPINTE